MGCQRRLNGATIFASPSCLVLTSQALVSISSPSQHLKARQLLWEPECHSGGNTALFILAKRLFSSPPHYPVHTFDRMCVCLCGSGNLCECRRPPKGRAWTGTPGFADPARNASEGFLFRHAVPCVNGDISQAWRAGEMERMRGSRRKTRRRRDTLVSAF